MIERENINEIKREFTDIKAAKKSMEKWFKEHPLSEEAKKKIDKYRIG